MNQSDHFETSDLALASTLFYFGLPIEAMDYSSKSRVVFLFERSNGLDEIIQGFWAHELKVDPLAYFNSVKEVKSRIYG